MFGEVKVAARFERGHSAFRKRMSRNSGILLSLAIREMILLK